MINIKRYEASYSSEWDEHVRKSRNGTFLFLRGYMDYHADRFCDHSLMFYRSKTLLGILPASTSLKVVTSHAGLTYGGFILSKNAHASDVGEMLDATIYYYRSMGFDRFVIKPLPHIYHTYPSDDELYWIFRHNAKLCARGLSSTIRLDKPIPFSNLRKRKVKKAQGEGYRVLTNAGKEQLPDFWGILEYVLQHNHSRHPVHTLSEIRLLQNNFPDNILLATVINNDAKVIAGTLLYVTEQVVHAQYIASSPEGAHNGALDLMFSLLVEHYSTLGFRYFDFGISTEDGGTHFNEGLNFQKEGFGARSVIYDAYELFLS